MNTDVPPISIHFPPAPHTKIWERCENRRNPSGCEGFGRKSGKYAEVEIGGYWWISVRKDSQMFPRCFPKYAGNGETKYIKQIKPIGHDNFIFSI